MVLILTLQCFLSITPSVFYSEVSEWILDMGATYHVCSKQKQFANVEKLDADLVSFGDRHTCYFKGICTVRIKIFDETVKDCSM